MKILVAFDPNTDPALVLQWARSFSAQFREEPHITLLHVVPIQAEGTLGIEAQAAAFDFNQASETVRTLAPDSEFEVRFLAGSPGPIICAEAVGFDLVVVGSRGRSPLGELLMGSVSSHVVHHAPCSVLVAKGAAAANAD